MSHFVGLDVSQKMTAICVVDKDGRRVWRGQCPSVPEQISAALRRYAGDNARIGIETGAMTPWIVHELRNLGFEVICLDARHARAALKMQINKNDQNDAEGLAQIVRTGWYRTVHVKSFDSHRARAILGARTQLVGMTTRLSNHIRGVLKTFGLLPGAMRGLPFDRKVEVLLEGRSDVAPIVRPMLVAWRQLRVQIAAFDKAIRAWLPTGRRYERLRGSGLSDATALARCGSGYRTYIITTRRMISGELLKYRNGLLMAQAYHGRRHREHLV
jgi:transposase